MAADAIVTQELNSLQQELSASQKERVAATAAASAAAPPLSSEPVTEAPEEWEMPGQLGELIDEVTQFFQEAEKNIAAHPAQSVIGALLVGILIGRVVGRR